MTSYLLDHLWQSTLFALLIGVTAVIVRNNRAHVRYWLWLAASVKFLIPFSLLMYAGSQIELLTTEDSRFADLDHWFESTLAPASTRSSDDASARAARAENQSLAGGSNSSATDSSSEPGSNAGRFGLFTWAVGAVWLAGLISVLALWFSRWARIRDLVASSKPTAIPELHDLPIPVLESSSSIEPGIVGIFKPLLLMPKGITDHLTDAQLQAVVAHELTHWRRRDNLTASIHMFVEAVFWFHPFVWWIGARLIRERERACDETTVTLVEKPEVYAEGILRVCQYYAAPPLRSAASISGGELRHRIELIVANLSPESLSMTKKVLLTALAIAVVAGPILLGSIEPTAAQQANNNEGNPGAVDSLYGLAFQEGSVNVMAFDPRDATWMVDAFSEAFPGITVNIRTSLGHLPMIISDAESQRPSIDVVLTSLIEGNALYEEGYLVPTDFASFGVAPGRVVLNSHYAYTNSIVYTVVYDSRRVGDNPEIPLDDPDSPNKIPATWRDLLDEDYAGKMSTNPFVLPRAIAGLGTIWGISAAEDYARRLAEDQEVLAVFGSTLSLFTDETRPQMYYLAQVNTLTEQWETQGLTTDYVVPEPMIIEQQGTAVMATAPHPAAAALLAGWLASPEAIAIRKRVADSSDLTPDSDDELAIRLRSRGVEIVYDTPATTAARAILAETIQPYFPMGINPYEREPAGTATIFQPAPDRSSPLGQALEELRRALESQPE